MSPTRAPSRIATSPPEASIQRAVVSLLRGEIPAADFAVETLEPCLRRYECGGYLHRLWTLEGRIGELPHGWGTAIARAHRKTVVDNLAALAEFRAVGRHLAQGGVPFILLKGASYLIDLYDDPSARMLTDIDLLVQPKDVGRIARQLAVAGYRGDLGIDYPEYRRFEMLRRGKAACRFEFHWWLGLPFRLRIDQRELWEASSGCSLEGIKCRRLAEEDALLYHVAHQADHYFGPTLKWVIDLREMLRRWRLDPDRLVARSAAWRVRAALYISLLHVEKLFPGQVPGNLLRRLEPGALRKSLVSRFLSSDPVEMIDVARDNRTRYALRPLLIDRPTDALGLSLQVLLRPAVAALKRLSGRARPPWEWSDSEGPRAETGETRSD